MLTELYWIDGPWPGKLAISARTRGGDWLEDEMRGWRRNGIDTVVSLLTPAEMEDLALQHEARHSNEHGLRFLSLPIEDRSVPRSEAEVFQLLEQLERELAQGRNVVIHCRQGVGRSGLIAASLLIARGVSPTEAMQRISAARGVSVPETAEQHAWITAVTTPSKTA